MIEKYINDINKEVYKCVNEDTSIKDLEFHEITYDSKYPTENRQWALHTNIGSITVLDRMTGYGYGIRDIETGFRDMNGEFWLASGNYDVRDSNPETMGEAIKLIKKNANTCIGIEKPHPKNGL